jgi:hypothetical protein
MVVAMATVRVMQVTIDEVITVVAVRNTLVTAAGSVRVRLVMSIAVVSRRAVRTVVAADLEHVLVDVAFVLVVQMAVMQVVGMAMVLDGQVAAIGAVHMVVSAVNLVSHPLGSIRLSDATGRWPLTANGSAVTVILTDLLVRRWSRAAPSVLPIRVGHPAEGQGTLEGLPHPLYAHPGSRVCRFRDDERRTSSHESLRRRSAFRCRSYARCGGSLFGGSRE